MSISVDSVFVLVVSTEKWMVMSACDLEPLFSVPRIEGERWKGGVFLDDGGRTNTVLVWTASGRTCMYTLPDFEAGLAPLHQNVRKPDVTPPHSRSQSIAQLTVTHSGRGSPVFTRRKSGHTMGEFSAALASDAQREEEEEQKRIMAIRQSKTRRLTVGVVGGPGGGLLGSPGPGGGGLGATASTPSSVYHTSSSSAADKVNWGIMQADFGVFQWNQSVSMAGKKAGAHAASTSAAAAQAAAAESPKIARTAPRLSCKFFESKAAALEDERKAREAREREAREREAKEAASMPELPDPSSSSSSMNSAAQQPPAIQPATSASLAAPLGALGLASAPSAASPLLVGGRHNQLTSDFLLVRTGMVESGPTPSSSTLVAYADGLLVSVEAAGALTTWLVPSAPGEKTQHLAPSSTSSLAAGWPRKKAGAAGAGDRGASGTPQLPHHQIHRAHMLQRVSTTGGESSFDGLLDGKGDKESQLMHLLKEQHHQLQQDPQDLEVPDVPDDAVTATEVVFSDERHPLELVRGHASGALTASILPRDSHPRTIQAHRCRVTKILATTSQPRMLVTADSHGLVLVWNPRTWKQMGSFAQHAGPVVGLFNAPADQMPVATVVSAGLDRTVALYDLKSMQCVQVFGGHSSPVTDISWKKSGGLMFCLCLDATLFAWEVRSGRLESHVGVHNVGRVLARDNVLHRTAKISLASDASATAPRKDQPIEAVAVHLGSLESPLQALVVNVKDLLKHFRKRFLKGGKDNLGDRDRLQRTLLFTTFSYLIPWGLDGALDAMCRRDVGLEPPEPAVCYGIKGTGRTFSVFVPEANSSLRRWQSSPHMTAAQCVFGMSLAKVLLSVPGHQSYCSALLTLYGELLRERVQRFAEPSLPLLARWYQDTQPDIQDTARILFSGVLSRMSASQLTALIDHWMTSLRGNRAPIALTVLAIIGSKHPQEMEPHAPYVTQRLMAELKLGGVNNQQHQRDDHQGGSGAAGSGGGLGGGGGGGGGNSGGGLHGGAAGPSSSASSSSYYSSSGSAAQAALDSARADAKRGLAAELLGMGFATWRRHIVDVYSLLRELLFTPPGLRAAAEHSLLAIGGADPDLFIDMVFREANKPGQAKDNISTAVEALAKFAKRHAPLLIGRVGAMISAVLPLLDPHMKERRAACQRAVVDCLLALRSTFPAVAINVKRGTMAVCAGNQVVVYSLNLASKIKVFEAASDALLVACCFSEDGAVLAAYAPKEAECILWRVDEKGLLKGLFSKIAGSAGKDDWQVRHAPLTARIQKCPNPRELGPRALLGCSVTWSSIKTVGVVGVAGGERVDFEVL